MSAHGFYYIKGLLALTATVLLIFHMTITWPYVATLGRRLRYLSLLWFAVLVVYASVRQVRAGDAVSSLNVLALVGMVILIITAVVSIREDHRRAPRNGGRE